MVIEDRQDADSIDHAVWKEAGDVARLRQQIEQARTPADRHASSSTHATRFGTGLDPFAQYAVSAITAPATYEDMAGSRTIRASRAFS
jgi:hypothetical protein